MSEQPKPKILTRLRIDEISLVDKGAGRNCKVLISKRDDSADGGDGGDVYNTDWYREQAAIAERQNEEHLRNNDDERKGRYLKFFLRKSPLGDEEEGLIDEPEHVVDNDGADGGVPRKHRPISFDVSDQHLTFPNERATAVWLAAQSRIRKSNHEDTTMPVNLSDVVKNHGVVALCKYMIESSSSFGINEHELVALPAPVPHLHIRSRRRSPSGPV